MRPEVLPVLLSSAGQRLLEAAEREYAGSGGTDTLALGARLRRDHDPDLVAAVLAQVALRRRAVTKLGAQDASRMYLTPEALEQATPRGVAEHRAARLAAAGPARLVDLGCGIGSDLVAAARAGLHVTGIERDPVRAALARANLAALGLPGRVEEDVAEETDLSGFDLVFADPSRRDPRGRVFDPAAYCPPWSFVEDLLRTRTACVKVSPAIPHRLVPPGVQAEWVSHHGDVKEAALWSGSLVTAPGSSPSAATSAAAPRCATVLPAGATLTAAGVRAEVGPVGGYLYEPDGAVIRAGLVAELAERLDARLLDPQIAYLTADRPVETPYARCYAVVERLPYREKPLRAALRALDVGTLTIKKRGVEVTPETLRRRLRLRGSRAATIVLARVGGAGTALLVEPVSTPGG